MIVTVVGDGHAGQVVLNGDGHIIIYCARTDAVCYDLYRLSHFSEKDIEEVYRGLIGLYRFVLN